jgi:hypothetical protein
LYTVHHPPVSEEVAKMSDELKSPDLVMWVGTEFYPTIDSFVVEAMNLGCSKRVPKLPEDAVPGKTRVFLAHDEGKTGHGVIFGFFVLSGIEIILDDPEKIARYQEKYTQLNVKAISSVAAHTEPRRLCGERAYGAAYLVSGQDAQKAFEAAEPLATKADVRGDIVVLLHPIPYPRIRFRGWRYMEPEFLAKYDWPQRSLPVKRMVKIEPKVTRPKKLPLLEGLEGG